MLRSPRIYLSVVLPCTAQVHRILEHSAKREAQTQQGRKAPFVSESCLPACAQHPTADCDTYQPEFALSISSAIHGLRH